MDHANKTKTRGVRFTAADNDRLEAFFNETGIEPVALARAATLAALDHYETAGKIVFPLKVVSKMASSVEREAERIKNQAVTKAGFRKARDS